MNKKLIPTFFTKSIYDLPLDFFIEHQIKFVLTDLDNTLDDYLTKTPSKKALKLKNDLEKIGIKLIIISNNRGPRVQLYAESYQVLYLANTKKPGTKHMRSFIEKTDLDLNQAIYIGDQVISDILFANRLGVRSILVDPLSPLDQPITRFNRIYDRILRRRLAKLKPERLIGGEICQK